MLLAILTLGGAILGATTIAGLLMLYQIRATTDIESSAKAVFAADAGVEWAEFDFYCAVTSPAHPTSRCILPVGDQPTPVFSDCETGCPVATVTCSDSTGTSTLCSDTSGVSAAAMAVSKGAAVDAQRAFLLNLTGAAATLP